MLFLGLILLVALMIPILGIVIDSPIGKALAHRLEGSEPPAPPPLADLQRRIDGLEGDVEELQRSVQTLQEENQFLQRLLEDPPARPSLPPPKP